MKHANFSGMHLASVPGLQPYETGPVAGEPPLNYWTILRYSLQTVDKRRQDVFLSALLLFLWNLTLLFLSLIPKLDSIGIVLLGLGTSFIWLLFDQALAQRLNFWEAVIRNIEVCHLHIGHAHASSMSNSVRLRQWSHFLPRLFGMVWLALLVRSW